MYFTIMWLIYASVCGERIFPSLYGFISGKHGFERWWLSISYMSWCHLYLGWIKFKKKYYSQS